MSSKEPLIPITLQDALKGTLRGDSLAAIIVFADVRSFSAFCKAHDSAEVALYISKLFQKLIDHFSGISKSAFYKSTGDGLLMVFPYEEEQFESAYKAIVSKCLDCHDSFSKLLKG